MQQLVNNKLKYINCTTYQVIKKKTAVGTATGIKGNTPHWLVYRVLTRPLKYGIFRIYEINIASVIMGMGVCPICFSMRKMATLLV